jgi:small-conductance mechanosensitive channel
MIEFILSYLNKHLFVLSGTPVTLLSLIIFGVTLLMAVTIGNLIRRAIYRMLIQRGGSTNQGLAYSLGRMGQYIIVLVGILVGLENLGVSLRSLAAFGAVLMVGIGFGLQNIAQNFISGLILLIERPVQKGDFVQVGDTAGTVEEIAMRATRIHTRDGALIIVPNSELITGRVVNRSAPTSVYRVRIPVGAAYHTDTAHVRETLLEVARQHARVLKSPPPYVFFQGFGESQLEFQLAVWIDAPAEEFIISSELRFAIDAAFRKAKIEIPRPQRELLLKKGELLS